MLRNPRRARAWALAGAMSRARLLPAALALLAVAAAALLPATPAWADHVRDQQLWVLDAVHAPAAWPVTEGRGVTVAVIDSGVNPSASDLAGSVIAGPDLTGVGTRPSNPNWGTHGTWMAALIAGHGHGPVGGSGIIGVAPLAQILSIRVVTDAGDPGYQRYQREPDDQVQHALARAIRYAATHHAGVISMSLGYGAPSLPVRAALQFALDHAVVVVASAGNSGGRATARDGQAPYSFPADYPGVLGVGAVAQDGTAASFSSANLSVQVAAPGVMVPTQGRDGKYWYVNGTSPACALTAGVAALIKSRYPGLSPALVDEAITATAVGRPRHGYDDQVGFGIVDAAAALAMAQRLAHRPAARRPGVAAVAHFGGGPGAVPPAPVSPRSGAPLRMYGVLAFLFLLGGIAAGRRLRWPGRARAGLRRQPAAAWPAGDGQSAGSWAVDSNGQGAGGSWPAGGMPGAGSWQRNGTGRGAGSWPGQAGYGAGGWPGGGEQGAGSWAQGSAWPGPGPGSAAGGGYDADTWPGHGPGPGAGGGWDRPPDQDQGPERSAWPSHGA